MIQSIHRTSILVGILALLGAILASPASAAPERSRYIVVFEDSVQHPGNLARAQVGQRGGKLGFVYRHALKGYSAELPEAAIEGLRKAPGVELVAPDREVELFAQSVPTGIERTFAAANKALDIDGTNDFAADVDIAVIDTGVDHEHPDLDVVARTDCSNGTEKEASCANESGADLIGHGTHVAGTAAAIDNGEGVVGIAAGARVWGVKALGSGTNYDSEIAAGIDWVTARSTQIEVVNMSLGCFCELPLTAKAIEGSVKAGVVHVVAAGNNFADAKFVAPANHPDVTTVSALADFDGQPGAKAGTSECREEYESEYFLPEDDSFAIFSNDGAKVEVAAPGVCILSTVPGGGYAENGWWGTSMATPHVAGAAALLASKANPANKADVEAIRSTIVAEGNSNWNDTSEDGVKEPLLDVSDEALFKLVAAPQASSPYASNVTPSSATLNASVNPKGAETTYQFEYGKTTAYGSKVPASPKSIGSGTSFVNVKETIEGLEFGATYHFRVVATNAGGTVHGPDTKFVATVPWHFAAAKYPVTLEWTPLPAASEMRQSSTYSCDPPTFEVTLTEPEEAITSEAASGGRCPFESTPMELNGCELTLSMKKGITLGPPGCGPITYDYYMAPGCPLVIPRDPPEPETLGFWGGMSTEQVKSNEVKVRMDAGYSWTVEECGFPVPWASGSWMAFWNVRASDGTNITFEQR